MIKQLLKKLDNLTKRIAIILLWLILLPLCSLGIFYSITWSYFTAIFLFPICVITIIFIVQKIDELKDELKENKDDK